MMTNWILVSVLFGHALRSVIAVEGQLTLLRIAQWHNHETTVPHKNMHSMANRKYGIKHKPMQDHDDEYDFHSAKMEMEESKYASKRKYEYQRRHLALLKQKDSQRALRELVEATGLSFLSYSMSFDFSLSYDYSMSYSMSFPVVETPSLSPIFDEIPDLTGDLSLSFPSRDSNDSFDGPFITQVPTPSPSVKTLAPSEPATLAPTGISMLTPPTLAPFSVLTSNPAGSLGSEGKNAGPVPPTTGSPPPSTNTDTEEEDNEPDFVSGANDEDPASSSDSSDAYPRALTIAVVVGAVATIGAAVAARKWFAGRAAAAAAAGAFPSTQPLVGGANMA